jgi:hypothetical protein
MLYFYFNAMEHFVITLRTGFKDLKFTVEWINRTPRSEQFRIKARNKTIVIESNRPLFRNKGLLHRKPDFKLVEGQITYTKGINEIAAAIMNVIEPSIKKKNNEGI